MSDDQETNYSVQVHPPSDSKNSGNEGGKGQITTTRTPNTAGSGVQSSFQDQSTDQKNSTVVNKGQPGSIASNTEETTRMKEVVYLDDLQEHLTVSFKEGLGQLKDDIHNQSQDVHQINSELVTMHRDVNKLLPQSKEFTLLRNSVESAHANINTVGSVVVAVKRGIGEVKFDVPETVNKVSNPKTYSLGVS